MVVLRSRCFTSLSRTSRTTFKNTKTWIVRGSYDIKKGTRKRVPLLVETLIFASSHDATFRMQHMLWRSFFRFGSVTNRFHMLHKCLWREGGLASVVAVCGGQEKFTQDPTICTLRLVYFRLSIHAKVELRTKNSSLRMRAWPCGCRMNSPATDAICLFP
jgi:hypothetical protein